ncbi:hypothetical protein WDU94_014643 [Cyamophila willieti]
MKNMYNSSASPIKNIFLTLYLLNNTFNENLFYDKETHELKQEVQDGIDEALSNPNNTAKDIKKLPVLKIPAIWDREQYPSSILRFLLRKYHHKGSLGLNYQSPSQGFPIENHGDKYEMHRKNLLDPDSQLPTMDSGSDEIGDLNKLNNETIINQKNFFIILPESTKDSSRKNYSKALNQVVKNGKGAANMLSKIIKTKINKTTARTTTLPGIPQKVLDAIQNTTCPVYVIHEGTTLYILPKNKDSYKRVTEINVDRGTTTTVNKMDSIINEISTSIMPSAISIYDNVKNKTEKYVKSKVKKESTTTKKIQTQKIKIASTSNSLDNPLKGTTDKVQEKPSKTSTGSNNLTVTILNTLNMLNKDPKTNVSVSTKAPTTNGNMELAFLDTTCFPVLKISDKYSSTLKVIMMNQSDVSVTRKNNKSHDTKPNPLPITTVLPTTQIPTTLATNTLTSRIITPQPTILTSITSSQMKQTSQSSTIIKMTIPTANTEITQMTTSKLIATEQAVTCTVIVPCDKTTTKRNILTTEQGLAVTSNCEEAGDDDEDDDETCIDIKTTTCKHVTAKTCKQDEKNTQPCCKIRNQSPKEGSSCPTKEPDKCTSYPIQRKQRLTTQMLQQNIFSPTLIDYGKQKNSSLLVIKLISERPVNFENQVQNVHLVKSKHRI